MSIWLGNSQVAATRANLDLVPNLFIDPQDFGLVQGMTTDALPSLQAAVNAAAAAGGGVVLMPSGALKINGGLSVGNGVTLRGANTGGGYGTLLSLMDGYTASTLTLITLAQGAALESIAVSGRKTVTTVGNTTGISVGSVGCRLTNVFVLECTGDGIVVNVSGAYAQFNNIRSSSNSGSGLRLIAALYGQYNNIMTDANQSFGIRVDDTTISAIFTNINTMFNVGSGIWITGRNTRGIVISGFLSYANNGPGVELFQTDGVTVNGGTSTYGGSNGVALESSRWNSFTGVTCIDNSQVTNGGEEEWFIGDDGGGSIYSIENTFVGCSATINGGIFNGRRANYGFRENTGSGPNYITGGKYDTGTVDNVVLVHPSSRITGAGKVRDTDDPQTSVSTNYTAVRSDYYIRVTTGTNTITVTLPDPSGKRYSFIVVKVDNGVGTVSVVSAGTSKTLNGSASLSLTTQYQSTLCVANGTNYECS